MKIYKYPIKFIPNEPTLLVLQGELLSFNVQYNNIVCYATYSELGRKNTYEIILCETGAETNNIGDKTYMGTLVLNNGMYILHAFAKLVETEVHI